MGAQGGSQKLRPERYSQLAMLLPVLAWVLLFLFVPLVLIGIFSFYTPISTGFTTALTWRNYVTVFTTPHYLNVIGYTVLVSAVIVALCFAIGYPTGYFLAFKVRSENTRLILILILIIPFWIDFTTKLMAWFPILGSRGAINYTLLALGLIGAPLDTFILSPSAAILVMVQTYVLFMIAPVVLSLANVDRATFEAAESLGASRLQTFRHVTLPLSRPGIIIGSAFVFVTSMGDFVTPRVLGGIMQTAGLIVAQQAAVLNLPLASALSVVLTAIALLTVFLMFKAVNIARMVF